MSSLSVHPTKGLDPRLTYCRRCGGDCEELTLGAIRKGTLPNGQLVYADVRSKYKLAQELLESGDINHKGDITWSSLDDYEKVPVTEPCNSCKSELLIEAEEVKKGGVYIKCIACGVRGVIKAETNLAKEVRANTGIQAPNSVGLESAGCGVEGGMYFGQCPNR